MNRSIAHAASASTVVGGLAAGLVLALASSSVSTEPAALSLPSIRSVPEVQACGYDPMDWSANRASSCASKAVDGTLSLTGAVVRGVRGTTADAIRGAVQSVDRIGEYASGNLNRTVKGLDAFADRTVATSLTTAGHLANEVEETAESTVEATGNYAVRTVLDTRDTVSETAVETTGTATNVVDGGVTMADSTADGASGTVDCVSDITVGDMSINGVHGCSS